MKYIDEINRLQEQADVSDLQGCINNGSAWKMEGSVGREAMQALESGECYLPLESFKDYYGNIVPSREDLKGGTKGTLSNSINYWGLK